MVSRYLQNTSGILIFTMLCSFFFAKCSYQRTMNTQERITIDRQARHILLTAEIADNQVYRPGWFNLDYTFKNTGEDSLLMSNLSCTLVRRKWLTTNFSPDQFPPFDSSLFGPIVIEKSLLVLGPRNIFSSSSQIDLDNSFFLPGDNYFRMSCECQFPESKKNHRMFFETDSLHLDINTKVK